MTLSGIPFIFGILPLFLIVYFFLKPRFRIYALLVFSIWFYAVNDPEQLKYMLAIIAGNYVLSLLIARNSQLLRKFFLVLGLIGNVGILLFYKYLSFLCSVMNQIFGCKLSTEEHVSMVGLSFFTFTFISYLVDVYCQKIDVPKNPVKFVDYILMFPKILMGPIVRYEEVSDAFSETKIRVDDLGIGAKRFMAGFA